MRGEEGPLSSRAGTSPKEKEAVIPAGEFGFQKALTQEDIDLYAEASGDDNPIHVDRVFAAGTPFGGTIAHGMLVLAYIAEMMAATFGPAWFQGGKFKARFKAPARPGDTLIIKGKVRGVERDGDSRLVKCEVACQNQKGEDIVVGEAEVSLPPQ